MKDGYSPAGNDWIFYRESGSGEAVLFIHAGVADSRMWVRQLESVPDGFRFVAYDQRGFGNTELGSGPFKDHEDAIALMDNLGIDRAILVGCSMGAGIALDLAIDSPERVAGLVLVGAASPGFEPEEEFEPPQWPEAVEAFKAGDFERVAQLDAEIWLFGQGRDEHRLDPELVELFLEMDLKALRQETERDERRADGPDRANGIRGIQVPTLVVVGEHDLPDLLEHAHHLAERLSRRAAVVVEDAAHLPSFDNPAEFNNVLFDFLEKV